MGIEGDLANPEMASRHLRGAAPVTDGSYTGVPEGGDPVEQNWLQKAAGWLQQNRPAPQQQSAGPGGRMGAYQKPSGGGRMY